MIHPIIDEYYSNLPSHHRSARLARDMGQMSSTPTRDEDVNEIGSKLQQHRTSTLVNGVDVRLKELNIGIAQLEVQ